MAGIDWKTVGVAVAIMFAIDAFVGNPIDMIRAKKAATA